MGRRPYPSDLTDRQWTRVEPLIPPPRRGYGRWVDMREVVNAVLYRLRAGCGWGALPRDLPPTATVYEYFRRWQWNGTWAAIREVLDEHHHIDAGSGMPACTISGSGGSCRL